MEDEMIAGIPQAALDELVERLKLVALMNLPSQQKIHLVEFVRVYVIRQADEDGDADGTRTLSLFLYLAGQGIASPDIMNEVFQQFFPDDEHQRQQNAAAQSANQVQQPGALQPVVAAAVDAPPVTGTTEKHEKKRPATGAKRQRKLPLPINSTGAKKQRYSPTNDEGWARNFALLLNYQRENGHCRVPDQAVFKGANLGDWVGRQRKYYQNFMAGNKQAFITQERIDKLNEIGFDWSMMEKDAWNQMYKLLCDYQREYGHCCVPLNAVFRSVNLGSWVFYQREVFKNFMEGKDKDSCITLERIGKLTSIGFDWTATEKHYVHAAWNQKFTLLLVFQCENGHCRVPAEHVVKSVNLGRWVSRQRAYYWNFIEGKVKDASKALERIVKLNAIGFEWTLQADPSAKEAPALEMPYNGGAF